MISTDLTFSGQTLAGRDGVVSESLTIRGIIHLGDFRFDECSMSVIERSCGIKIVYNGWRISYILSSPISNDSIYPYLYNLSYCFIWLLFTPTLDHFCWRIPRSDFLLLQLSSHCSFAAKGTQDAVKRKVWPLEDSCFHLIFRCNHLKRRDRGDLPTVQWIHIYLLKPEEMQKQEPTRPYWEMWTEHTTNRIGFLDFVLCSLMVQGCPSQGLPKTNVEKHPWNHMKSWPFNN